MNRKNLTKIQKADLERQFGRRCGFPGCRRPAEVRHHPVRFAYGGERLVPLCKTHHELAHLGLIENETGPVGNWRLRGPRDKPLQFDVDKKWEKRRRIG